jgi:hypothetical protein
MRETLIEAPIPLQRKQEEEQMKVHSIFIKIECQGN